MSAQLFSLLTTGFLPFYNNGPVFGLPQTMTGDIRSRTQLTCYRRGRTLTAEAIFEKNVEVD
jgi:hypothetical protein